MRTRLREALGAMRAAFPLSESLWLDWVADELQAVGGAEDLPAVQALLEVAVQDYLSVPLWVQYLE
jgi:hypothetical protein